MVTRLLLSCIVLICMARELFAQVPVHHEGQDLPPLPVSMTLGPANLPMPKVTPDMVEAFMRSGQSKYGLAEDIGDLILLPADLMFDCVLSGLHCLGDAEQDTITSRVMSVDVHNVHLFTEFITHFYDREAKFLGGVDGTYLSSPGLEDGTRTIDMKNFMVEQKKVMWDVLKKTYFAKYRFHAEERLNDDAFYLNNWRGVDFVALPPFLAGYLYYRGLDKSFTIDELKIRTLIEPGSRLLTGNVIGAVMIDVRPRNWPIGIVGSVGLYKGHPEFEFIGIGTTIDAVKKAIVLHND